MRSRSAGTRAISKLTAPLLGFDVAGSIGNVVTFSKSKGRTLAKEYKMPDDPKSPAQVLTRDTLTVANGIWKSSGSVFRDAWQQAARGQVRSGYNEWIGRYTHDNRGQPDFSKLIFAPKVNGGLSAANLNIFPIGAIIVIDLTLPTIPIGWSMTKLVGAGIPDQDPATATDQVVTVVIGAPPGPLIILFGLQPATTYAVSAWIHWITADGVETIGESLPIQKITTNP